MEMFNFDESFLGFVTREEFDIRLGKCGELVVDGPNTYRIQCSKIEGYNGNFRELKRVKTR